MGIVVPSGKNQTFLAELLASHGGRIAAADAYAAGRTAGITGHYLNIARRELGIPVHQVGAQWTWGEPAAAAKKAAAGRGRYVEPPTSTSFVVVDRRGTELSRYDGMERATRAARSAPDSAVAVIGIPSGVLLASVGRGETALVQSRAEKAARRWAAAQAPEVAQEEQEQMGEESAAPRRARLRAAKERGLQGPRVERAAEFLVAQLQDGQELALDVLRERAVAAGIGRSTIRRARRRLGDALASRFDSDRRKLVKLQRQEAAAE